MTAKMKMGIVGCGDFLRWQSGDIKRSERTRTTMLFDPDRKRAEKYAQQLGGSVADSADQIIDNPDIGVVCLFVPPWVRKDLILKAAAAGKHIIATKPLGPTVAECAEMVEAVEGKVCCGVLYRRSGNSVIETYRKLFQGGEIGRLALYRQDWMHHYPQWNTWALDPKKNGGPFMDAMVHNMNTARYLMDRKATQAAFFSDNHAHPGLTCNDTEFLKLDFAGNGSAHLFITWAADMAVYSTEGNDREHIEIFYQITDQGWRVTEGNEGKGMVIVASREGKQKKFPIEPLPQTTFDRFSAAAETGGELPSDIPSVREAYEDIKIIRDAEAKLGRSVKVNLKLV